MKRILLFVLTNLAVMVVVGIVTSLLGVGRYTGTNTGQLMVFSLVVGFSGAIVSLLMSRFCRVDGQATCSSMLSTLTEKV